MPTIPWKNFTPPEADRTYVVVASHLPVRSFRKVPMFLRLTMAIRKQLAASEGLVGYSLVAHPLSKSFWTLSAWEDETQLRAFTRGMPHLGAVRAIGPHMGPSTFVMWEVTGKDLPASWADAMQRVREAGVRP
jgi:hypothetical protein